MADAHDALLRAIKERIGSREAIEVRAARSESWASATFSGSRHSFALRLSGPAASTTAARLAEGLDAIEFRVPGHLVADIAMAERADSADCSAFTIEALTVEDR